VRGGVKIANNEARTINKATRITITNQKLPQRETGKKQTLKKRKSVKNRMELKTIR